jgi:hypothetical protein
MRWDIIGASHSTGEDITLTLSGTTRDDAARAASDLGVLISKIEPHKPEVASEARATLRGPIQIELTKQQLKQLRRVSSGNIGVGVLYGLILWTAFCFFLGVIAFLFLGYTVSSVFGG